MSLYYRIRIWLMDWSIDSLVEEEERISKKIQATEQRRRRLLSKFVRVHYG